MIFIVLILGISFTIILAMHFYQQSIIFITRKLITKSEYEESMKNN